MHVLQKLETVFLRIPHQKAVPMMGRSCRFAFFYQELEMHKVLSLKCSNTSGCSASISAKP